MYSFAYGDFNARSGFQSCMSSSTWLSAVAPETHGAITKMTSDPRDYSHELQRRAQSRVRGARRNAVIVREDCEPESPTEVAPSGELEIVHDEPAQPVGAHDRASVATPWGLAVPDRQIEDERRGPVLARYLREMAAYRVMDQAEELRAAIAVEQVEVDHWSAILSFRPGAKAALASLERDLPTGDGALRLPQLAELHRLLLVDDLDHDQEREYSAWCTSLAKAIRSIRVGLFCNTGNPGNPVLQAAASCAA